MVYNILLERELSGTGSDVSDEIGGTDMLKGKVAVVTGGTRGIGYAIVKKYLENGAKVVLFGDRKSVV